MVILRRGLASAVVRGLGEASVVVIEGGRAVGKSTLCRTLAVEHGWTSFVDLTDPVAVDQLRLDPIRFLADLSAPVIVDEAQLVPELLLSVKRIVDERGGEPGQFLLTGSARLGRAQLGGSDPLAGRSLTLRLWPLTQAERAGAPLRLAERLFDSALPATPGALALPVARTALWQRGGLPGIPGVLRSASGPVWERAMAGYVEAVLPLGVGFSRVDLARVLRAFRYLAANPGQQLVLSRMANQLSIKADTARAYLDVLEAAFLVFRAEAQRPSEHKVLTAHPRLFATDTGLAAWAMGLGVREPKPRETGSLFENRVAVELASTVDWTSERIIIRHWRDQRSKHEVDLLLLHADGRGVAVETKASSQAGPGDTIGLVAFALANPDTFHRGIVVYTGDRVVDLTPPDLPRRSILAIPAEILFAP